jgi:hypothetical protein
MKTTKISSIVTSHFLDSKLCWKNIYGIVKFVRDEQTEVRSPTGLGEFSLLQFMVYTIQTGSENHTVAYSMGIWVFPRGKAPGA